MRRDSMARGRSAERMAPLMTACHASGTHVTRTPARPNSSLSRACTMAESEKPPTRRTDAGLRPAGMGSTWRLNAETILASTSSKRRSGSGMISEPSSSDTGGRPARSFSLLKSVSAAAIMAPSTPSAQVGGECGRAGLGSVAADVLWRRSPSHSASSSSPPSAHSSSSPSPSSLSCRLSRKSAMPTTMGSAADSGVRLYLATSSNWDTALTMEAGEALA